MKTPIIFVYILICYYSLSIFGQEVMLTKKEVQFQRDKIRNSNIKVIKSIHGSVGTHIFKRGFKYDTTIENYDKEGKITQSITIGMSIPYQTESVYYYNSNNELVSFDGNSATFEYDQKGNIIRSIGYGDVDKEYEYDSEDKLIKVSFWAEGQFVQESYSYENDLLLKCTDNRGGSMECFYDKNLKKVKEITIYYNKDTTVRLFSYLDDLLVKEELLVTPKDLNNFQFSETYYYDDNKLLYRKVFGNGDYTDYFYEFY